MIRFKEYLNEMRRGSSLSDLLFIPSIKDYNKLMIPISSSMYKRIWPETLRATVFHTTNEDGFKTMAKLQGKKKQISAFFSMFARYMEIGVATQGGVHSVLEMDADVLLSASGDIMSHMDRVGRRYTSISDLQETSRFTDFKKVEKDLETMFTKLVNKYLERDKFQSTLDDFGLWHMAKRKVDGKTMSLIIKDYLDGVESIIKKNIKTFSSAMLSYAKKRETEKSWDEQVVNNFKVKTAHFFKLPVPVRLQKEPASVEDHSLYPEQEELIAFAKSQGWKVKMWDAPIELEVYTREVAKKELGK